MFFVIGPFCTHSDMTVLYGSDAFSILVLSTKRPYSSFLKEIFIFQKIYFKIKVLKLFKHSTGGFAKACRRLFWTSLVQFFLEESMLFLLALTWTFFVLTLEKAFSIVKTKTDQNSYVYLMKHIFQISALF